MSAPYEGGCICGAIRYRVTAEPLTVYVCHCTDCQCQSGASFALSMIVVRGACEVLQGEPREFSQQLEDGRNKQSRFCSTCGTRLWGEPAAYPQILVVSPGTLDDTSWISPVAHIWTRSAQPWVTIPDDILRIERQPEDSMTLINAWRERQLRG